MMAPSQSLGFAHTTLALPSQRSTAIAPLSFDTLAQTIATECIDGSAIAPTLFQAAIALVDDQLDSQGLASQPTPTGGQCDE